MTTKYDLMTEYLFNKVRAKEHDSFAPNVAKEYRYRNEQVLKEIELIENDDK